MSRRNYGTRGWRPAVSPAISARKIEIAAIYQHIKGAHGQLDILVNNAVLEPVAND